MGQAANKLMDPSQSVRSSTFAKWEKWFLFETGFYERRTHGLVSSEELNNMMEQAQRDAFHNALGEYHPHF